MGIRAHFIPSGQMFMQRRHSRRSLARTRNDSEVFTETSLNLLELISLGIDIHETSKSTRQLPFGQQTRRMSFKLPHLLECPRAFLGDAELHVVNHESDGPYKIYVTRDQLATNNTDFILNIKFSKPYYCVFRHQTRKIEIVGEEVDFSGFEGGNGEVERFNIATEDGFTDPESIHKARKQAPVIWMDIHEIKGRDYYSRSTEVDGFLPTLGASKKAVFYTDHEQSRVKYGSTSARKGPRLGVIKFEVEIVENMTRPMKNARLVVF